MRSIKALSKALILALFGLSLSAVLVSAAYTSTINVNNTSTTSYNQVPLALLTDVSGGIAAGFYGANGFDIKIKQGSTELPKMIVSDRIMFVVPSPASGQTNLLLSTGNTPATAYPIIVGDNGLITVADAAALEFGSNYSFEYSGYVDTTAYSVGRSIIGKDGAYALYISSAGNVTSSVLAAAASKAANALSTGFYNLGNISGSVTLIYQRDGQTFTPSVNSVSMSASLYLETANTDTRVSIWQTSGGLPTVKLTESQPTAVPVGPGDVTFTYPAVYLANGTTYALVVENWQGYPTPGSSNLKVYYSNAGPYASGTRVSQLNGVWSATAGSDLRFQVNGCALTKSVAMAVSSGAPVIKATSDGVNMKIYLNGAEQDTIATSAVLDNANNWIIPQNYTTPYATYIKFTIGGTLIVNYAPNAMISGTTLPDLEGAAQNGTITWPSNPYSGANPYLVTVTASKLEGSGQIGISPTQQTPAPGIGDVTGGGQQSTIDTRDNPGTIFDPIINQFASITGYSPFMIWIVSYIGIMLICFALTFKALNSLAIAGVTSLIVSVAYVMMGILDWQFIMFGAIIMISSVLIDQRQSI